MLQSETINHNALKFMVEADAINKAIAVAHADKWSLHIQYGSDEIRTKTVIAKNSGKTRIWRKLDTLAKYLLDLGVYTFETDVTKYDPTKQTLRRPDSAAALKRTHLAHKKLAEQNNDAVPAYNAGLSSSPEASSLIRKQEVSPTEVRESWEKRRARILEEENPRAK